MVDIELSILSGSRKTFAPKGTLLYASMLGRCPRNLESDIGQKHAKEKWKKKRESEISEIHRKDKRKKIRLKIRHGDMK